jgi:hypothetical protein
MCRSCEVREMRRAEAALSIIRAVLGRDHWKSGLRSKDSWVRSGRGGWKSSASWEDARWPSTLRHAPIWISGRRSDTSTDCHRLNLDIRQRVAAVGRRVNTLCQGEDGLRQQLVVYHTYYISAYRMRAYASPCWFLSRPTAVAPPSCGARVHRQWRQD